MLHYIHIQGKEAPMFYFRDKTAQNFKSIVQSITEGPSLVISSLYRTDIIYQADREWTEKIIQLWALQEKSFDEKKLQFVHGREKTLELFFTSLVSFSHTYRWYQDYLKEFGYACALDRNNPILKDLKRCEKYLQTSGQTVLRSKPEANTHDLLPHMKVFQALCNHINDFLN